MLNWDDKTKSRLNEMHEELASLLKETTTSKSGNWLDLYDHWSAENPYEFILYLQDGFKEFPPKEILYYDSADPTNVQLFDAVSMSVFISQSFVNYSREVLEAVIKETHPDNKSKLIRTYFDFIGNSKHFDTAITLLNRAAGESGVLQGEHPVDIVPTAYCLYETLEKYSVETIFLLFNYWRITSDISYLQQMIASIVRFFREYYKDYGKDERMHLDWAVEKEPLVQQINILSHWEEIICLHTQNMIEAYKERKWFIPVDKLVDGLTFAPFISYFEMLKYQSLYPDADNTTVAQKGTYYHRYGVWIKTVDIFNILSQTASILYNNQEKYIKDHAVRKASLLELADNLKKLKEHFSNLLFTHKEFYDSMRQKYSLLVLETHEHNARIVNSSVDELMKFNEGLISNDIDALMRSKQAFVAQLSGLLSDERKTILDEKMNSVIEKIKEEIKKLDIYTVLYGSVTSDFSQYAQHLLAFPDIFCSLVSAEYLYSQYIKDKQPLAKFDYSCISILYYMALEDFANKLLYTSYAINVLDRNASSIRRNYVPYICHQTKYWDFKNRCYKRSCEIGNLGHLFNALNQESMYSQYLLGQYPNIDIPRLIQYGVKLINIAPRRNDAAHGGNIISYNDACIDKENVYDLPTANYRGLIMELFSIIFP